MVKVLTCGREVTVSHYGFRDWLSLCLQVVIWLFKERQHKVKYPSAPQLLPMTLTSKTSKVHPLIRVKISAKFDEVVHNEQLDRGCPNGTNTPPRGQIFKAHPWLMGRLHVKFHDDRCKKKVVMRRKPFSVIYALWPWPLTFWPQNL